MKRYCDQCGTLTTDDSERFCSNCGNSLPEIIKQDNESDILKNRKIIIALLIIIIALFSMLILISGALDFRTQPALNIETASPMTDSENFQVTLTDSGNAIEGKEIRMTFKNNANSHEYTAKTNNKGVATAYPSVELGDYDVICEFERDSKYSPVTVTKEITVKEKEPDYQSFYQSRSFEDTDSNGDGYVYLNDMNIAHTTKNIQERMFADSDDDSDGKLNHDEYYKFVYKLNYDYHSYGL